MDLTTRQAKLLGALARKHAAGTQETRTAGEFVRPYWDAVGPIVKAAIRVAAPEIGDGPAARIAREMICGAARYTVYHWNGNGATADALEKTAGAKPAKAKKTAAAKPAKKKAAPKKAKAGTELDLMKQAAAKAGKKKAAPKSQTVALAVPGRNTIICVPRKEATRGKKPAKKAAAKKSKR